MGTQIFPFVLGKDNELRLPAPLTVVATAHYIDLLRQSSNADLLEQVTLVSLSLDEPFPADVLQNSGVIVSQMDPAHPASMKRVEQAKRSRPDVPQIVALTDANVGVVRTLLRQGVADVLSLPLDADELLQAALSVLNHGQHPNPAQIRKAPVIAVVQAVGGSGATTIATHLAHQLGKDGSGHKGVCLIDLDIQYGSVSGVLGLRPRRNLSDLLEAEGRLDADFLRSVAVKHEDQLSVIAAPDQILPLEQVDSDQVLGIIEIARQEYDFVIIDLPTDWTNWNLSVVLAADSVLMVVDLTIASLHQAKRRLELFASVGVKSDAISIVVNRVERRIFKSIGLGDVANTLGREVLVGLHADGPSLATAQDQGLFVDQVQRKSRFSADVATLGTLLAERFGKGNEA